MANRDVVLSNAKLMSRREVDMKKVKKLEGWYMSIL